LAHVATVFGKIEHGANFAGRALGQIQKMCKIFLRPPLETFPPARSQNSTSKAIFLFYLWIFSIVAQNIARFHELGTPRFSRHAKVYQQLLSERHPCYELASGCKNPSFDRCKSVQFDFEWHKRKRSCTYGAERYVVHDGHCGALNLVAELEIANFLKCVVNLIGQDACALPNLQVFKIFCESHTRYQLLVTRYFLIIAPQLIALGPRQGWEPARETTEGSP